MGFPSKDLSPHFISVAKQVTALKLLEILRPLNFRSYDFCIFPPFWRLGFVGVM